MIYRITKYDPTLRDAEGRYLPWTWTSYSDIGRAENGCALCPTAYLETERRYTDALICILQALHVDFEVCFQLQLRECFWCRLIDPQGRAAVWFGYDYYMYVACEEIPAALVREICAGGLYVEAQTTKGVWLNQTTT